MLLPPQLRAAVPLSLRVAPAAAWEGTQLGAALKQLPAARKQVWFWMCDLEHVTRCTWHDWSEGQAACSAGCSVVAVGELGRFGEGWQRLGPSLVASLSQNRNGFIQEAMHVCLSPQLH